MIDMLIMIGGIGGTWNVLAGVYALITGRPSGDLPAGPQIVGGAIGVVVGYQAWRFKMRRTMRGHDAPY